MSRWDLEVSPLAEVTRDDGGNLPGCAASLSAAADLFDEAAVQVMAARLGRVLAAAAAGPGTRLREVQVLDPAERAQLVDGWNDTAALAGDGCAGVPGLVAARAAAAPDAVAVVCGDEVVSRTEQLDGAGEAARLAGLLAAGGARGRRRWAGLAAPGAWGRRGDGGGDAWGCVAGGGGLPAPGLRRPPERITFMLDDADPVLVIADRVAAAGLPPLAGLGKVIVDDPLVAARLAECPGGDLGDADRNAVLLASHPAYVIYTSGSTGRPKGVVVTHGGLASYVCYARRAYRGLDGLTLWHASVSFDGWVTVVFGALASGGCIHVAALDQSWAGVRGGGSYDFVKATLGKSSGGA